VIAIIAILASLLLPSLGKAKQSAKQVLCGSNMRQVGQLLVMYSGDNQGYCPKDYQGMHATMRTLSGNASGFVNEVKERGNSIKGMWLCPEQKAVSGAEYYVTNYALTMGPNTTGNYGGVIYNFTWPATFNVRLYEQLPPGSVMIAEQGGDGMNNVGVWVGGFSNTICANPYVNADTLNNWAAEYCYVNHGLSANLIFADLHYQKVKGGAARFGTSLDDSLQMK